MTHLFRVMEIKAKVNKWDLIKLKKLLYSKGNYKQGEKQPLELEKTISEIKICQMCQRTD